MTKTQLDTLNFLKTRHPETVKWEVEEFEGHVHITTDTQLFDIGVTGRAYDTYDGSKVEWKDGHIALLPGQTGDLIWLPEP